MPIFNLFIFSMLVANLKYDKVWIAEIGNIHVKASSLDELDLKLKDELRKAGFSGKIEILMKFDYYTIPHWMRQFHPHYFNRRVIFDI